MDRDVRSERNRSSRGSGNWKWARMSERARHTGEGVARRKAHQERQRDEREQREEADRAAGTALPPEEGGVELVSADDVLKGVAETGPNYTLLPKRERKAKRRRRRRAAAEASGESADVGGARLVGAEFLPNEKRILQQNSLARLLGTGLARTGTNTGTP